MAFGYLSYLITMEESPANKSQHPLQIFAIVHAVLLSGFLFDKFLTWVQGFNSFFLSFWSVFLSQLDSSNSGNWEKKSQNVEMRRQSSFRVKKDDENISREEVEMIMESLTLFCSPESEELPSKLNSSEISRLFEEKETSLEEVKETFDVFDHNKDGFIDALELQRVLLILGLKEGLELENCTKMIRTFDENGDGRIDFNEFVKFMESRFVE